MNLNTKSSRGITLIALVVTIIVLLILAGISISMLSGDNGLLQRATDAKDQIDRARKIEQEQIDNLGGSMNDFVDGYDENKNVNKPKLTTGMVPVNYNTSKKQWEECSLENWDWNYEEQSSTTENGGTSKWANAMTEDGILVNIDGNSNRVSAIAQGPKKVVFIVGMNKVCSDLDGAMKRARNVAAPINAQRFGLSTPCAKTGACMDCKSPDTICCQFLITRFSRHTGRIHVILVNDNLGF